jgi:hypothetical protein
VVFGSIAQDMDGADISVVVDAVVGEGLTKGRDERGFGGRSFDILQKAPLAEFVVGLHLPFAIIVVDAVIGNFGEFCAVTVVVVGHDESVAMVGYR